MKLDAKILDDLAAWFESLRDIKFSEILDAAGKFDGGEALNSARQNGDEFNAVNQKKQNLTSNLSEKPSENLALGAAANRLKNAANVAFISVDMIEGFCSTGPLASPRVQAIADGVARTLTAAYAAGVRNFALIEDCHEAQCAEFGAFPPPPACGQRHRRRADDPRAARTAVF